MTFYKRKKAFTLIELIIVIVVVGLLTGLAVPKFVGISRDAQVANLYRDMDTLSKAIDVYYINEESYPVEDLPLDLPDGPLLDIIKSTGDSGTQLHKVNLKKSGKYHSKLKHGYDDSAGDFFLYSKETDQIFYAKGVLNADGDYVYGYALLGLKNVLLGDIPLFEGKMTEVDKPAQTLTGMIPREDSVSVQLNGEDIPVIYDEDSTYSGIPKNIYASPSVMKTFKVELILNKNVINQIKLTYKNKEYRYHVNVIKTEQKYLDEITIYIRNKNNKNLQFFDINGNSMTKYVLNSSRNKIGIVMPAEATKIFLYSMGTPTIYDIYEAEDIIPTQPVQNISAVPGKTSLTINWINPNDKDFEKVYILRDGKILNSTSTGTFTETCLYANTEYTYELIAVDTTGNWSESKFITAKTLERDIYWYGLSGAAFDGDKTTYYKGTGTVTWDGDLTRKVVHIDVMRTSVASTSVYNYYMYIRDENNKNLVFYDTDGNSMTSKNFPKNNRQTFSIVMPEGASKIVFSSSQGTANVYDVCEADDLIPTAPVSNLTGVPAETTVTLNWTNPNDDDFKTVWIFRDGVRIGASSTGTFADTKGLSADTEYSYQIYAVDETGNLSEPTEITIKTLMQ